MADSKITALTSISTSTDPANDPLVIVDVSDTSMAATGTTKKVTLNQLLGASGTATLASATITGDLTVDTSTLKVDSANDRVGFGTASPAQFVHLSKSNTSTALTAPPVGGASLRIQNTSSTNNNFGSVEFYNAAGLFGGSVNCQFTNQATPTNDLVFVTRGSSGGLEHYRIAADGVCTWSEVGGVAGTAMTLNSTGLGVGGSPTSKLSIFAGADGDVGFFRGGSTRQVQIGTSATAGYLNTDNGSAGLEIRTQGTARAYFDNSGNVGIGVAPSAWNSSYRGLQLGSGGAISAHTSASLPWLVATSNSFINSAGDWKFINNGYSTRYLARGDDGTQSWWTSNNGLAGGTVAYTQAMTLDASGNLLVGKSVSLFSTVGVEASGTGFISATNSASTNATTNLSVYSTGAAAFRFYVGLGGTVFATNTTISAISDSRLKENVQDIDVGLGAILALKPRKFDWKAGKGKDIKGDRGFIAQEFEEVFPNLIDEWKDAAPEGEAPYKSVRQDLIPVLVKAIQELTARVQTLETR